MASPIAFEYHPNAQKDFQPPLIANENAFLGDVFASPAWLPLRNVYSPGDLLLLAGAVWVVHAACGTVLARDPRPWLRGARAG